MGFSIASKEGALLLGWAPTLIGYSMQVRARGRAAARSGRALPRGSRALRARP